jgi:class 3 adenylate cyclase
MSATALPAPVLRTLVLTDLVDSTRLVGELGDQRAIDLFRRHDRLARDLLAERGGQEIDKSDGFLLLFERPLDAVSYALAYHAGLLALAEESGLRLLARVGIHLGEVYLRENLPADVARGAKPVEVEGLAKPLAARLMSLAGPGQTLLSAGAFDLSRRAAAGALARDDLRWLAHGAYRLKGVEEPVEVFEVGLERLSPLQAPADSEKARRVAGSDAILGWRPAPGLDVPHRPGWGLLLKLGEGGFGEAWLASHRKTRECRVFKFCFDAARLRALKREVTICRLLKEALGDRQDITHVLDWNFEEAPYYVEFEAAEGGSLLDWAGKQGGLAAVPLPVRLEIVAQIAEALGAAHSVGVLHKDVKPANVLLSGPAAAPRVRLTDFGIGRLTDESHLQAYGITTFGLTEIQDEEASGTRLYLAPELIEGRPASVQADVYALGVILYQAVIGDFSRVLAPGWHREVEDELLREDIEWMVEGSPARRLGNASRVAERLRSLALRREQREAERRLREEAERARAQLVRDRRLWRRLGVALAGAGLGAALLFVQDRRSRVREELARRLAGDVAAMEQGMRLAYLLPAHDIRPAKAQVRDRLREIGVGMSGASEAVRGAALEALGRGHLALGEGRPAHRFLQQAWDAGDRRPELAWALGQAMSLVYRDELQAVESMRPGPARDAERTRLAQQWRDPVIALLRQAGGAALPEYVEALVAFHEQRLPDALSRAQAALARDPLLHEAHVLRGSVELGLGNEARRRGDFPAARESFARAEEAYRGAAAIARSDPRPLLGLCNLGFARTTQHLQGESQGFAEALRAGLAACEAARAVDPERVEAERGLAQLEEQSAEFELALHDGDPRPALERSVSAARRGLAVAPDDVLTLQAMGNALATWAEYDQHRGLDPRPRLVEARAALESALGRRPGDPNLHNDLAYACLQQAEWESRLGIAPGPTLATARSHLEQAVALDPGYATPLGNLAWAIRLEADEVLRHGGDPRPLTVRAAEWAGKALAVHPRFAYAWFVKGDAHDTEAAYLVRLGEDPKAPVREAVAAYAHAAELSPTWVAALAAQATAVSRRAEHALDRGGDPRPFLEAARGLLEQAKRLDRGAFGPRLARARLELLEARASTSDSGAFGAAAAALQEALAADPGAPDALLLQAELALQRGEWHRLRKQPAAGDALDGLAALEKVPGPDLLKHAVEGALRLLLARSASPPDRAEAARAAALLGPALAADRSLAPRFASAAEQAKALAR